MNKLRLGIPKGSLQDATVQLFARAGFNIYVSSRSYFPAIDDPEIECMLIRAQEMARYVSDGVLDAGLDRPGLDRRARARSRARPASSSRSPTSSTRSRASARFAGSLPRRKTRRFSRRNDLEGKTIATELVRVTRTYFERSPGRVKVEFSWGATEVEAPGPRRRHRRSDRNRLDAARQPPAHSRYGHGVEYAAHRQPDGGRRPPGSATKLQNIALLLRAAIEAQGRVGLMLNVRRADLDAVLAPAAGAAAADDLGSQRRRVGGGQHDHRRADGPRPDPPLEGLRRQGHRGISAQQDRAVTPLRIIPAHDRTLVDRLLAREKGNDRTLERRVAGIVGCVKSEGDVALRRFARRFDGVAPPFEVRPPTWSGPPRKSHATSGSRSSVPPATSPVSPDGRCRSRGRSRWRRVSTSDSVSNHSLASAVTCQVDVFLFPRRSS